MSKDVIYCQDCIHYEADDSGYGWCSLGECVCKPDDYCSKGEKGGDDK